MKDRFGAAVLDEIVLIAFEVNVIKKIEVKKILKGD